jgi:hypothetical protein
MAPSVFETTPATPDEPLAPTPVGKAGCPVYNGPLAPTRGRVHGEVIVWLLVTAKGGYLPSDQPLP